jgi:hypothetical protein
VTTGPYTFQEAREAAVRASEAQKAVEAAVRDAYRLYAQSEQAYRVELAKRIAELIANGASATRAGDLARGDKRVADLKFRRDVAEGVREATVHAAWRRTADRKDTQTFIGWSMRRDLAEFGPQGAPEPDDMPVIGSRRAA